MNLSLPDGREVDLSYFVEWRPYLWQPPVAQALGFLGDLQGQRVLEIGGRSGRMSCLMAMMGAYVTMLEHGSVDQALKEVRRWGVQDRVRIVGTDGGLDGIAGQQFDVLFTKSVLWSIRDLQELLARLAQHLAPGGKVAFVENNLGGRWLQWIRRHVGRAKYLDRYFGIRPDQLPLFGECFSQTNVRSYWGVVYVITGRGRLARTQAISSNRLEI